MADVNIDFTDLALSGVITAGIVFPSIGLLAGIMLYLKNPCNCCRYCFLFILCLIGVSEDEID
tara:strand:- start:12835 stop:13023 length:189 start_codon:yes stop_codon:yes gene_type:complete